MTAAAIRQPAVRGRLRAGPHRAGAAVLRGPDARSEPRLRRPDLAVLRDRPWCRDLLRRRSRSVARRAQPSRASAAVITTIGLILLYQQATGHWESWAYAWALLPAAVGFGLVSYGALTGDERIRGSGWPPLTIGFVLFLAGAAFFEGVLGLGGPQNRPVRRVGPAGAVARDRGRAGRQEPGQPPLTFPPREGSELTVIVSTVERSSPSRKVSRFSPALSGTSIDQCPSASATVC